jgi:hypothetical protein
MKQFFICLNLLLLTMVLSTSCRHEPSPDCYQCANDAFTGLSGTDFENGVQRYKTLRSDLIDATVLRNIKPDARSCWYSIDTLKKFICLMETYSKQVNISPDSLGIRFYYAVYPDSLLENPIYSRLHTLFLVSTLKQNNANVDFDPRYLVSVAARNPRVPIDTGFINSGLISNLAGRDPGYHLFELDYIKGSNSTQDAAGGLTSATPSVMSRNQGQLCPNYPNCPTN